MQVITTDAEKRGKSLYFLLSISLSSSSSANRFGQRAFLLRARCSRLWHWPNYIIIMEINDHGNMNIKEMERPLYTEEGVSMALPTAAAAAAAPQQQK